MGLIGPGLLIGEQYFNEVLNEAKHLIDQIELQIIDALNIIEMNISIDHNQDRATFIMIGAKEVYSQLVFMLALIPWQEDFSSLIILVEEKVQEQTGQIEAQEDSVEKENHLEGFSTVDSEVLIQQSRKGKRQATKQRCSDLPNFRKPVILMIKDANNCHLYDGKDDHYVILYLVVFPAAVIHNKPDDIGNQEDETCQQQNFIKIDLRRAFGKKAFQSSCISMLVRTFFLVLHRYRKLINQTKINSTNTRIRNSDIDLIILKESIGWHFIDLSDKHIYGTLIRTILHDRPVHRFIVKKVIVILIISAFGRVTDHEIHDRCALSFADEILLAGLIVYCGVFSESVIGRAVGGSDRQFGDRAIVLILYAISAASNGIFFSAAVIFQRRVQLLSAELNAFLAPNCQLAAFGDDIWVDGWYSFENERGIIFWTFGD